MIYVIIYITYYICNNILFIYYFMCQILCDKNLKQSIKIKVYS